MSGALIQGPDFFFYSDHPFASVYFDFCLEIHNNILRYELRNFESVNIYLEGEVYKVRCCSKVVICNSVNRLQYFHVQNTTLEFSGVSGDIKIKANLDFMQV